MSSTHLPGGNQALLGCSATELERWAVAEGQPAFRGRQLHDWLYTKGARSFEAITVLPKSWRLSLQQRGITIGRLLEVNRAVAVDDTTKLLLATVDGETIESVGIPTQQRLTVCLSSQVGCPMACRFCASGKGGLQRSLAIHEIVDQVLSLREAMDRRPSHVVFMGMGEPLLNIEAVLASIRCLNIDLGIAQRRITVSTVGVPHTLPQLAELAMKRLGRAQFTLAVSLHAPNQELRERLIPTACAYPFETLLQDCRHYLAVTGRRVTFEYILLGALNDQPQHAEELADRVRGFQSHVNLIAYNPIDDEGFQRPNPETIEAFRRVLEQRGVAVSLRASRGLDQNAACGQLRRQHAATG
ncbi:23S rRNA (adenine(2503)-C(2))-methyltransferase RlmN [Prochlorococcus marinus]|uniref:23S rRNA (adenine(2503)-C(2))-methyltransferase RlmN n=1 Tax=Prochlorococcus TaxID=1218 RepID=UPI0007B32F9F|nr:23S rRNA (adenine(2503)-C(2))-methyltransferase RlmN [Prochlorococcus marinus]KZR77827.1 putative dual-specificity RNA methyltransferase RlmN [Prochlorococcus marinus str. MIT 1323]MEC9028150.1 23S rRNA (adenine(2503)-C(2))-methyltransferase RlmN [Cyanobacteriota bacterium]